MATDDHVRLHANKHDWDRAARNRTIIPVSIPRTALDRVVELKAQGLSFHTIAREVPEVISADGAHVALREALNALPMSLGQPNTGKINHPRYPFDGRPGAPAWTPADTKLAGKLRPLERPTDDYPSAPPPADYWDALPQRADGQVCHPLYGWGRVINGQHTQADGLPSYLP